MKKLIAGALAVSLIATPALAAPQPSHAASAQQHDNRGNAQATRNDRRDTDRRSAQDDRRNGPQNRGWHKGERFDQRYARNYSEIRSPGSYRLQNAPRGYHWVRSGNDAVLVGIATGLIAAVMANAIR